MKLRTIMGEKLNMSQVPDKYGRIIPVTAVRVEPNTVVKLVGKKALIAFGNKKRVSNPIKGIVKHIEGLSPTLLRMVDIGNEEVKEADAIRASDCLAKGDVIDVTGTSKGKGFAGVVKRHGFAGGPKTHGQSDRHRAPGSIGATTTPGRVIKGLRMAGRMGNETVTVKGLEIMDIDEKSGIVLIKGAVPGSRRSVLILKRSLKKKKAYHVPEVPAVPQLGKEEEAVSGSVSATSETPMEGGQTPSEGSQTSPEKTNEEVTNE